MTSTFTMKSTFNVIYPLESWCFRWLNDGLWIHKIWLNNCISLFFVFLAFCYDIPQKKSVCFRWMDNDCCICINNYHYHDYDY